MSEISGSAGGTVARRLRLGMVGGGQGAFIGAVHRLAARMDDRYELVAGALSSDPARAKASAAELHIAPERAYGSFAEMAKKEAARKDGIDVSRLMSDARGIAFSAGSACASGSGKPSRVLQAIGLPAKLAKNTIRLGFGRYTTGEDLEEAAAAINAAAQAQGAG